MDQLNTLAAPWLRSGRTVVTVLVLAIIPLATFLAGIRLGSAQPVATLIAEADHDLQPSPRLTATPPVVLAPEPFIPARIPKGNAAPRPRLHERT